MSNGRKRLAAAGTLLGQLQRGRGTGYREAVQCPTPAEALVFDCIVEDPRWDRQLEERGSYYAGLLLHFESDLAPLERLLREDDPDECGPRLWPAFSVLEVLAKRGRREALSLLRGYVEYGRHWPQALRALQGCGPHARWPELREILRARFPNEDELAEDLASELDADRDPVPAWRSAWPKLEAAYRRDFVERSLHPSRVAILDHYASLAVAESFSRVNERELGMLGKTFRGKIVIDDRPVVYEYLRSRDPTRHILAVYGLAALGERQDWEAFQAVVEERAPPRRSAWTHLVRAAEGFAPGLSLPRAREWFGAIDPLQAHLGRLLLARYAEPEDRERLLEAIPPAIVGDQMYHLCSALEGIARLPAAGRLAEVEQAFEEATYSWARERAADAMVVHAPQHFQATYAIECLWDAEPRLRMLGARHADRSQLEVQERLAEMDTDPFEDDDVKEAVGG